MNRANEVRPIFRSLGEIAQETGCAVVLIGHLNKAAGTQSTYRGLGSIDITAAVRSEVLRPSSLEICFCLLRSCLQWGFSPGRNILQATF